MSLNTLLSEFLHLGSLVPISPENASEVIYVDLNDMKWEDLPESTNVEDRRGEKFIPPKQKTFQEMVEEAATVTPRDLTPPDTTSELAKQLGVEDICPNTPF